MYFLIMKPLYCHSQHLRLMNICENYFKKSFDIWKWFFFLMSSLYQKTIRCADKQTIHRWGVKWINGQNIHYFLIKNHYQLDFFVFLRIFQMLRAIVVFAPIDFSNPCASRREIILYIVTKRIWARIHCKKKKGNLIM